jgi:uncharacterized membrane protein
MKLSDRILDKMGGKRGEVLVLLGFIFILTGFGFVKHPELNPAAKAQLHTALQIAPIQFWGVMFIISGLVAMISSRWPPGQSVWGYGTLAIVSIWWTSMYVTGWLYLGVTGAYRGALSWATTSLIILIISGWEEYKPPLDLHAKDHNHNAS